MFLQGKLMGRSSKAKAVLIDNLLSIGMSEVQDKEEPDYYTWRTQFKYRLNQFFFQWPHLAHGPYAAVGVFKTRCSLSASALSICRMGIIILIYYLKGYDN